MAISKARKIIYSSDWVAKSAINHYGADPEIIDIIPLGANIENKPDANKIFDKLVNSKCNLVFIARDWERKGGKIVIETFTSLIDMGIDTQLFIIGCQPYPDVQHKKIHKIGFLDKNIPSEAQRFSEILSNSNFLLLPTRADCSPIAIVEANAYGIPVITTNVGGIPAIIKNGKNGYMLTLSAKGHEYAKIISDIFNDKAAYQNMIQNSRKEYDDRLNWDKWGEKMHQTFMDLMELRV
jgi:glycosyltransferase involved in cell wall biosynthesis